MTSGNQSVDENWSKHREYISDRLKKVKIEIYKIRDEDVKYGNANNIYF